VILNGKSKQKTENSLKDEKIMLESYQGCLYGLAIGDALGAPVEFLSLREIRQRYGKDGIADFDAWSNGWARLKPGSFTDDTQMSLATAIGCLRAYSRFSVGEDSHVSTVIYQCYLDWLKSQDDPYQQRAPGNTCLSALRSGSQGSVENRINNSKGCGGVMRTAPIGLAFPPTKAFQIGMEAAALTHGHPSGYLSAGFLSGTIAYILDGTPLADSMQQNCVQLKTYQGHGETLEKINQATELAASKTSVDVAVESIGQGWVGEEALAIALYCALRFPRDWRQGVLAAVNHSGDSDSTGSICGSILGTSLGVDSIPSEWLATVEDSERLDKIANDMYKAFKLGEALSLEEYPSN
jgi:ADP-ribosylglycohydrolase